MKLIMRIASARWKGSSRGGTQLISTPSGVLKQTRSSLSIPLQKDSTDPAELIAAAQVASFSLALSHELGLPRSASGAIATTAMVTMQHLAAGWTIVNIHLNVVATLPKVTHDEFIDATIRAKTTCLVSRLVRASISMCAKLEN